MPSIALLFPGQGAQFVGMGAALAARSTVAKAMFSTASEILNYDLLGLCTSGPAEKLNLTVHSQPALFVHSMATLAELRQQQPDLINSVHAVAGLSLGEYSALSAAESLRFEDGVRIVHERGAAMQAASESQSSGMASILGLTEEQVAKVCDEARVSGQILQIANRLCPGNIAISGHKESLAAAESVAMTMGATKYIPLSVAGAFHTELMRPAVARLSAALDQVTIVAPRFPVVSNVDGLPHIAPGDFNDLLPRQIVSPVLWESSLRKLTAMGIEQYYEIGAGRVLAGTLKRIDRKLNCQSLGD